MSSESLFISCNSCGKSYLKKLKVCPHCGKRNIDISLRAIIWSIIIIFVILLVINNRGSIKQSQQASSTNSIANTHPLPTDQNTFISIVSESMNEYRSAHNELQQSLVRNKRKQSLSQYLSFLQVNSWIGTIDSLKTDTEGKAYIKVKISPQITVKTWNNSFSDFDVNTMIEPDSPLYQTLLSLSVGQQVQFSGHFYEGESDYIREVGLTINRSMNKPEFLFKFTEIQPL